MIPQDTAQRTETTEQNHVSAHSGHSGAAHAASELRSTNLFVGAFDHSFVGRGAVSWAPERMERRGEALV